VVLLGLGRRLFVCGVYGRCSRHTLNWAAATQRAKKRRARVPFAAPAAAAGKRAGEPSRHRSGFARPACPAPHCSPECRRRRHALELRKAAYF
jgi:hypothetical protein